MKFLSTRLYHLIWVLISTMICPPLQAENGFIPIGFGAKSKAMGGAAVAYAQDTLGALINPAGLSDVGNRYDIAGGWVYHTQKVKVSNISAVLQANQIFPATYPINGSRNLVFGEGGISKQINECMTAGLLLSGQSGGIIRFQSPRPKVRDIIMHKTEKVFYAALTPVLALQFCENQSLGVGVDITGAIADFHNYQSLKEGIFGTIKVENGTVHPNHVTNKGWDLAWGAAVRVGYLWHIDPCFSVGISYKSKTFMQRFKKYEGIISPRGRADLPEIFTAGFSLKITPQAVFAFDYSRIYFHNVPAFGNKVFLSRVVTLEPLVIVGLNPHGSRHGAGFSFQSRDVFKFGLSYELCESMTLRAGYNYGKSPISRKVGEPFLPLTVEQHLTLGGSWECSPCSEVSLAYIHGFKKKLRTHLQKFLPASAEAIIQASKVNLDLTSEIDQIEIQYSKVF